MLVAYVSGHGFGHFVRSAAVLSLLGDVPIHLRTNGRALQLRADWAASVTEVDVGPGVAQNGPLATDLEGTRRALQRHLSDWPRLVEEEARHLRSIGARLVYGDVPPLAFAAAAAAGIPSVAMANFSWSWIYDGYPGGVFAEAAARMREAEAQATLLLELAMGGGLEHFPRRQPIAPIARPLARSREQVRAELPRAERLVLLSLGGFGEDEELRVATSARHHLLVTSARLPRPSSNASYIEVGEIGHPMFGHHELVAAVDCVIGKPGYGTVAECLRRPTPLCWLSRSGFREEPKLVEAIERWLPSAHLTLDDLASGRWQDQVDAALASAPREPPPTPEGATQAATLLRSFLIKSK